MKYERYVLISKQASDMNEIRVALVDFDARPLSLEDQDAIEKIKKIVVRLKHHNLMSVTIVLDSNLRFGSSSCSIWTSYTSFESSWPADLDSLSFGSIP